MQATAQEFDSVNQKKANFDTIYTLRDPREYYRVLCGLDYVIPELAKGAFRALIEQRKREHGSPVKVVDLGCSYGINAALLRFPLSIRQLSRRYATPRMLALPSDQLMTLDHQYFCSWPEQIDARFVGVDVSHAAVRYAARVGLIDAGIATNLEAAGLSAQDIELLRDADLICSTGCVGYVTQETFRKVLDIQEVGRMPWIANFVLRMFSYDSIAAELERFGLVTEKLEGVTFVQRRFHSQEECEATIAALSARGIDTRDKESDGLLHAELFVSRPRASVRETPLSRIVSITSGANLGYGRRYRKVAPQHVKLMN